MHIQAILSAKFEQMPYDAQEIESRWQSKWSEDRVFDAEIDDSKPKFYCLEMFPIHLGTCIWAMSGTTLSAMRWHASRD